MHRTVEMMKGIEGEIVLVVLLDQSKFFDKAEKNLTIRECHKAGIQGGVLYQLYQIINNREIRVKVNNAYSKPRKISNGSP